MLKGLIIRFFSAFSNHAMEFRKAEHEAIVEARKNIKLIGSRAERAMATKEWSKPENIALRLKEFEENPGVKPNASHKPFPVPDPLPQDMIGQSPSTIQAMLRHKLEKYISPKADMFGARYD